MAFNRLFGEDSDTVLKGDSTIKVSSLRASKYVGIYFSAHWCPPCKMFTPRLAAFYKMMKETGRSFEVVFASSDRSEDQFREYFGEMPWAAFPYGDARIAKASRKFKVAGIPTFVLLNAETGKVVTANARDKVMSDPQGADFPWQEPELSDVLAGVTAKSHDGTTKKWADLAKNDIVGMYFSAHWCGPCRAFTPQLVKTYNALKKAGKGFELIFVSSDRDESSFDGYWGDMPWLALPFAERSLKAKLSALFDVEGIPTLVLIDPKAGKIITTNGRAKVMGDKTGAAFPWLPQALEEVGNGADINATPILVLELPRTTSDDAKACLSAFREYVTAKKADWDSKGAEDGDYDLDFGYATPETQLLAPIRSFCNLTAEPPAMYIVDVPSGKKYLWTGTGFPAKADFASMTDGYLAGTLTGASIRG